MPHLATEDLSAFYREKKAVEGVTLSFPDSSITALIGPSGCGKSTYLRTLNRMHEVTPGAHREGRVLLDGADVYAPSLDPVTLRTRVGMVFQRPNPFPTMSIEENVLAGLRLNRQKPPSHAAEAALRQANLWTEVKDRLKAPASALSGGQQQRLCIARALAISPEVLLMDEPCSALDPISTLAIEDLMREISSCVTIVIVTHNLAQAARVSDFTAFFSTDSALGPGRLVEAGETGRLFANPKDKRTEDYITGRFG